MFRAYLEDFIIDENETVYKAAWQAQRNRTNLIVIDQNKKFKGIIGTKEIQKSYWGEYKIVKDICNENCVHIIAGTEDEIYAAARNIFAEKSIRFIPVIDGEKNVMDMFSRERAFFMQEFQSRRLSRMHYAECIYKMAEEAKQLGISRFSVIEFGVASGNGLITAEFYAKEISRLLNVEIEVYGFDNASGLPNIEDYRKEAGWIWFEGLFNVMDVEKTKKRLRFAKLILGDIDQSLKTFIQDYHPAPIGVMFVDVDRYASTCSILHFLEQNDKYFMPRIQMYFDDIVDWTDSIGEHLAVKEFNLKHENMKILPEDSHTHIKICSRYLHSLYNKPFRSSWEFTGCNYSSYIL
ncbi:MAG: CBS domain-containing protein [Lachnospiraceae bacterium]|nr:CBS domain-containing protein [Lachnospiraceae bacterium]